MLNIKIDKTVMKMFRCISLLLGSQVFLAILIIPFSASAIVRIPIDRGTKGNACSVSGIDLLHIKNTLAFDWKKKQAIGTTSIKFAMVEGAQIVNLNAGNLSVADIKLNSGRVLKFKYLSGTEADNLEIELDKFYNSNEVVVIEISYHTNHYSDFDPNTLGGTNGIGLRFFSPSSTEPQRKNQIWVNSFPESGKYWFPCKDSPSDLFTSELIATVSSPYTVVAGGTLNSVVNNNNGSKTFHYKNNAKHSSYNWVFSVGEYIDFVQKAGDVVIHNYGYTDELEATKASVERLPDMFNFFENITGVRYPFNEYSQAFVQDLPWGISGNGISLQTENMVDDYNTHAEFFYLWDMLEGEALAQQWFGNFVSVCGWNDAWMMKGMGRYFSELYNEYKNGEQEFLLYQLSYDQSMVFADWDAGIRQPVINGLSDNVNIYANSNQVGFGGAAALHMLRKEIGEENWKKSIHYFLKINGGKPVTTKDFIHAVEFTTGKSLQWFFDQWFYSIGYPQFVVTKKYDSNSGTLKLIVEQTQIPDTTTNYNKIRFFQGKIQIAIDNIVYDKRIEAQPINEFTFEVKNNPSLVNFDFNGTWLKKLTFDKSNEELLYQLQKDNDIVGRQWALAQLANKFRDNLTTDQDRVKICNALLDVMQSDCYWRLKYNAIIQLQGMLSKFKNSDFLIQEKSLEDVLLKCITNGSKWTRAAAISFLGSRNNAKHDDIFITYLNDSSDRVVNAAAVALGKSKSPKAFEALVKLKSRPSWKNQSLISTLNGLRELADERGYSIAIKALNDLNAPRWTLATPVWDFRIAAAQTITALNKSTLAYPTIAQRLNKSIEEGDINDIFNNLLIVNTLADERGIEFYSLLKNKYKGNTIVEQAISSFEQQFNQTTNKK